MTDDQPYSFTSNVDLPDGRHLYVSIEIPATLAEGWNENDYAEHAEIAQIGSGQILRNLVRSDKARARRNEVPF